MLEAMLEAITSNNEDVLESSAILQTLAVEWIAKHETCQEFCLVLVKVLVCHRSARIE
jgi:hypothetical protein